MNIHEIHEHPMNCVTTQYLQGLHAIYIDTIPSLLTPTIYTISRCFTATYFFTHHSIRHN